LLLLNRFIGENPFASERRQFCRIDSKRVQVKFCRNSSITWLELNKVELNFDLNTAQDYTTGQLENKTDLSVFLKNY
jgi:hypothetical protein